jgi:hypothetical protein
MAPNGLLMALKCSLMALKESVMALKGSVMALKEQNNSEHFQT